METGKYELVVVWTDGTKDVYEYATEEDAQTHGDGMKIALGGQIAWYGVRPQIERTGKALIRVTYEEVKTVAHETGATFVNELPSALEDVVVKMAMYTAECDEFMPEFDEVIDECRDTKIKDLDGLFTAYAEGLEANAETKDGLQEQFDYYTRYIWQHDSALN